MLLLLWHHIQFIQTIYRFYFIQWIFQRMKRRALSSFIVPEYPVRSLIILILGRAYVRLLLFVANWTYYKNRSAKIRKLWIFCFSFIFSRRLSLHYRLIEWPQKTVRSPISRNNKRKLYKLLFVKVFGGFILKMMKLLYFFSLSRCPTESSFFRIYLSFAFNSIPWWHCIQYELPNLLWILNKWCFVIVHHILSSPCSCFAIQSATA